MKFSQHSPHGSLNVSNHQCDQIRRFLKVFFKVPKSFSFLLKSFLGNFCRNLANFIWSQWWPPTVYGNFWKIMGYLIFQPSGHTAVTESLNRWPVAPTNRQSRQRILSKNEKLENVNWIKMASERKFPILGETFLFRLKKVSAKQKLIIRHLHLPLLIFSFLQLLGIF